VPLSEFDLIDRYFTSSTGPRDDVVLGIGDDCAVLRVPDQRELAVTIDTLVAGVHFAADAEPEWIGHKALAVGLSDLAAMGAEPAWATLALTLPQAEPAWLGAFSRGFSELALAHRVQLVGGDTTRGPLAVSVQVHGLLRAGAAMRRGGGAPGDLVYVTGTLGDAGLALLAEQGLYVRDGCLGGLREQLHRPSPRVAEGLLLASVASACIDVSDGLAADLGHLLRASACGATLYLERVPCSEAVRDYVAETGDWSVPLAAGDDYELCFTVPEEKQAVLENLALDFSVPVTWIGLLEPQKGLRCCQADGRQLAAVPSGYDHFAGGD
jgi:thiamine-monophosphate kinase